MYLQFKKNHVIKIKKMECLKKSKISKHFNFGKIGHMLKINVEIVWSQIVCKRIGYPDSFCFQL